MSERLNDIESRIATVHQLSAVITAMRGVAAARSREARNRLDGIRAYARTIAMAIGTALTFLPEQARSDVLPVAAPGRPDGAGRGSHLIVALCAEQGFAGIFSEHVLESAERLQAASPRASALMLVGNRGLTVAAERKLAFSWSAAMASHVEQAPALASRIVDALYERLENDAVSQITLVYALPGSSALPEVVEEKLVPFDFGRMAPSPRATPPLVTLPPRLLLARLVEEYVFAALCAAVTLSFAAENEARMRAMIAARSNVATTLDSLVSRARQIRQEAITSEIVELVGGTVASQYRS